MLSVGYGKLKKKFIKQLCVSITETAKHVESEQEKIL